MRRSRRWITGAVSVVALAGSLAYLHDPPWLGRVTSGLREWSEEGGSRFRWTNGHATFYVPADASRATIPIRLGLARPHGANVLISVDDRPVTGLRLDDSERWERITIPLTRKRTTRRFRRIDVRVDHVLEHWNRGVQLGEVQLER